MTTTDQTLAIIQEVFAAFRAHDVERFRNLLTPDSVLHNPSTGETFLNSDAIVAAVSIVLEAVPDLDPQVTNAFAAGEWGVAEVMRVGTHSGPLRLPTGEVPPSGRPLRLAECVVFRVADGKVLSMSAYTDTYVALQQFGLLEE